MTPYEKLKLLREKVEREKDVVLPIDKQLIINNLKNVYDPEMSGVNIYELGLIYTINIITTFDPAFSMDMVPEETKLMMGW